MRLLLFLSGLILMALTLSANSLNLTPPSAPRRLNVKREFASTVIFHQLYRLVTGENRSFTLQSILISDELRAEWKGQLDRLTGNRVFNSPLEFGKALYEHEVEVKSNFLEENLNNFRIEIQTIYIDNLASRRYHLKQVHGRMLPSKLGGELEKQGETIKNLSMTMQNTEARLLGDVRRVQSLPGGSVPRETIHEVESKLLDLRGYTIWLETQLEALRNPGVVEESSGMIEDYVFDWMGTLRLFEMRGTAFFFFLTRFVELIALHPNVIDELLQQPDSTVMVSHETAIDQLISEIQASMEKTQQLEASYLAQVDSGQTIRNQTQV